MVSRVAAGPRHALFKNSNLGMTPRIKLIQLEIRKRVAFARETKLIFGDDSWPRGPRTIGVIWSSE